MRLHELAIFSRKAPTSILEIAGGGRLIALEKPDNRGIRPVVVVDTSRKLALSAIAKQVNPFLPAHFLSQDNRVVQLACGVSRGTQKFHLTALEYLRLNKEDILVLADSDIAFQKVAIQRAVIGAEQLGEAGVPTSVGDCRSVREIVPDFLLPRKWPSRGHRAFDGRFARMSARRTRSPRTTSARQ